MSPALLRLAAARSLAWALLLGGWLVLGGLGAQHLPLWAGGLLPVALWLLATGVLQRAMAGRALAMAALRGASAVAALAVAALLWALAQGAGAGALLCAALAWAVLLVAASLVVRSLRSQVRQAPPPAWAALAGASAAWVLAGDPASLAAAPGLAGLMAGLVLAGLLLAALLRGGRPAVSACRGGLFDCAWPLPAGLPGWREPAAWPRLAALLGMLPMMASLPAMASACGSAWNLSPMAGVALHLGAMLLPAALWRRTNAPPLALLVALPVLGLLLAWCWPGLAGAMLQSLAHALAWGLAWAASLSVRPAVPARGAGLGTAVGTAAVVLLLGAALSAQGWAALQAVLAALAWVGAAGALLAAAGRLKARPLAGFAKSAGRSGSQ